MDTDNNVYIKIYEGGVSFLSDSHVSAIGVPWGGVRRIFQRLSSRAGFLGGGTYSFGFPSIVY